MVIIRLSGYSAVREGRFTPSMQTPFCSPGPRVVDGTELLAHLIHPDHFEWKVLRLRIKCWLLSGRVFGQGFRLQGQSCGRNASATELVLQPECSNHQRVAFL